MTARSWRSAALCLSALLVAGPASAEGDQALIDKHVALAEAAAGDDFPAALGQCKAMGRPFSIPANKIDTLLAKVVNVGGPKPFKVFDNLVYLGTNWVTAWAILTSDGIILFDALNNGEEAEKHVIGGLTAMGLDPADVKKIIVAHSHGDHYGGAVYLKEKTGAEIIMSETDWQELEKPKLQYASKLWGPAPTRETAVNDGDKVTLGDTSVEIMVTPGHTPGTITAVVAVKDGEATHKAVIWGGNGLNWGEIPERFVMMMEGAERIAAKAGAEGIDVFLSNHPGLDSTVKKADAIDMRAAGEAHPMVIGTDGVGRFMTALRECVAARLASFAPGAVPAE